MISSSEDRDYYRAPLIPWLWPTKSAAARAWKLSQSVHDAEEKRANDSPAFSYTDAHERIANVNARQDIAGLFSVQLALHKQLVNISRGVWVLALLVWILITAVFSVS